MNPSHEPEPVYLYGPPPAAEPEAPEVSVAPPPRPVRNWRRGVAVTAGLTGAMAVAGALLGLLWSWVSPGVPVINAGPGGIVINDPSPEEYIAADSWFTLIGFGFGIAAAITAWLVLRRDRGPALLLGVVLGGLVSALTMWWVGRQLGLGAWQEWQQSSAAGDTYSRPPDLHAHGALLVAAFAAVIVTTLLAGWSNDPDLDRPGAAPGPGRDLPVEPYPGQSYPAPYAAPDSPAAPGSTATPDSPAAPGSTATPGSPAAPGSAPDSTTSGR